MPQLPFKTQMSPVPLPLHEKLAPVEVTLRTVEMPREVWQRASLSDKMNAVMKFVSAADAVAIVERLDRENPTPPAIQYHERTVYVPAGAVDGNAPLYASLAVWLVAGAVVGGIFYWTVK